MTYNKLTNNADGIASWNGYYDENGNLIISNRYDKDLSLVHMDGDVPAGLILITRSDDHVSVDLAYEKETGNIMALLAALVLNGEKILEPDTRIVIPVVDQRIFGLLKEIAPEAKRGGLLKAILRFDRDMPVTPEEIESLLEE